jgi:hypothetical protein
MTTAPRERGSPFLSRRSSGNRKDRARANAVNRETTLKRTLDSQSPPEEVNTFRWPLFRCNENECLPLNRPLISGMLPPSNQ